MSEGVAICAPGLTKCSKHVVAVNTLDLNIPTDTVYGFPGPKGAGTSTAVNMLLGLVNPRCGEASVLGH